MSTLFTPLHTVPHRELSWFTDVEGHVDEGRFGGRYVFYVVATPSGLVDMVQGVAISPTSSVGGVHPRGAYRDYNGVTETFASPFTLRYASRCSFLLTVLIRMSTSAPAFKANISSAGRFWFNAVDNATRPRIQFLQGSSGRSVEFPSGSLLDGQWHLSTFYIDTFGPGYVKTNWAAFFKDGEFQSIGPASNWNGTDDFSGYLQINEDQSFFDIAAAMLLEFPDLEALGSTNDSTIETVAREVYSDPFPELRVRRLWTVSEGGGGGGTSITPDTIPISWLPQDPTIQVGPVTITPDFLSVLFAEQDPTIVPGPVVHVPDPTTVEFTIQQPTLVPGPVTIIPDPQPITLTPEDVTVIPGPVTIIPDSNTIIMATQAPTVVSGTTATPASGSMLFTPQQPTIVTGPVIVIPDPLTVKMTGNGPKITTITTGGWGSLRRRRRM